LQIAHTFSAFVDIDENKFDRHRRYCAWLLACVHHASLLLHERPCVWHATDNGV